MALKIPSIIYFHCLLLILCFCFLHRCFCFPVWLFHSLSCQMLFPYLGSLTATQGWGPKELTKKSVYRNGIYSRRSNSTMAFFTRSFQMSVRVGLFFLMCVNFCRKNLSISWSVILRLGWGGGRERGSLRVQTFTPLCLYVSDVTKSLWFSFSRK